MKLMKYIKSPFGVAIFSIFFIQVISGCATHGALSTTTLPTSTLPASGKVLPIQLAKGGGSGWDAGITLSDVKFTFGFLQWDYWMPSREYKKGDPVVYFSGTIINTSDKDWYTGFAAKEVDTLAYYGIFGTAGVFLPAGTSHSFNVALSYEPDLKTITVSIGVADIPWP